MNSFELLSRLLLSAVVFGIIVVAVYISWLLATDGSIETGEYYLSFEDGPDVPERPYEPRHRTPGRAFTEARTEAAPMPRWPLPARRGVTAVARPEPVKDDFDTRVSSMYREALTARSAEAVSHWTAATRTRPADPEDDPEESWIAPRPYSGRVPVHDYYPDSQQDSGPNQALLNSREWLGAGEGRLQDSPELPELPEPCGTSDEGASELEDWTDDGEGELEDWGFGLLAVPSGPDALTGPLSGPHAMYGDGFLVDPVADWDAMLYSLTEGRTVMRRILVAA